MRPSFMLVFKEFVLAHQRRVNVIRELFQCGKEISSDHKVVIRNYMGSGKMVLIFLRLFWLTNIVCHSPSGQDNCSEG